MTQNLENAQVSTGFCHVKKERVGERRPLFRATPHPLYTYFGGEEAIFQVSLTLKSSQN